MYRVIKDINDLILMISSHEIISDIDNNTDYHIHVLICDTKHLLCCSSLCSALTVKCLKIEYIHRLLVFNLTCPRINCLEHQVRNSKVICIVLR